MAVVYTTDNNQFLADGVTPNPNFGVQTQSGLPDPPAQPNNAGNPYFGKAVLSTSTFYSIVGVALGARYPRLRNDANFLWVYDTIAHTSTIDTDDVAGQFLSVLKYLETTNAASDGQPLMSAQDVAAIMAAWPAAQ